MTLEDAIVRGINDPHLTQLKHSMYAFRIAENPELEAKLPDNLLNKKPGNFGFFCAEHLKKSSRIYEINKTETASL